MKKIVTIIFMTLFCTVALAQKETIEKRNIKVNPFSGVEISGIVNVTIEKSASHSLSVETYNQIFEYLDIKVRNGVLSIGIVNGGIPKAVQRKYKNLEVICRITMPELKSIGMSGVTKLYVRDPFVTGSMNIELSGVTHAEIKQIECSDLQVEISGVSDIQMHGLTEQLNLEISGASKGFFGLDGKTITFADIEISGSGSAVIQGKAIRSSIDISGTAGFEGQEFEVEVMKAVLSGVAKAQVKVLGSLEPTVSGAAKLRYNRNVTLRNVNTSGAAQMTSY
ncbi:MAG: DUF2807 domain-containing protein [Bacteroidales bacterium]|nr:DUF2807 domain-containing protein [Bacteroidales bacterium]MDD4030149.1 DUF2807 domain-containing protein [Bacteroidales bacterium]MDD4435512.1 DUF2807 domain-containing protein [Bacteroidales bacterium]